MLTPGAGSAVVVDAGPDPAAMDRCLRRLGVRRVPLLVLTHFHADHVGGLVGVLRGRPVGAIEVSPLADPLSGGARGVRRGGRVGVPVRVAAYGETGRGGCAALAGGRARRANRPPTSESPPNDASVVLLVETRGHPDPADG